MGKVPQSRYIYYTCNLLNIGIPLSSNCCSQALRARLRMRTSIELDTVYSMQGSRKNKHNSAGLHPGFWISGENWADENVGGGQNLPQRMLQCMYVKNWVFDSIRSILVRF